MSSLCADSRERPEVDCDAADRYTGTAVNPTTFLATDYLNHFNEPIMLIHMIPSMPECLDELQEWRPKGYVQHFCDSGFKNRELCIEAFALVAPATKARLEAIADEIAARIIEARDLLADPVQTGNEAEVTAIANTVGEHLRDLIDRASGVINGAEAPNATDPDVGSAGDHIDAMQATVDALFD